MGYRFDLAYPPLAPWYRDPMSDDVPRTAQPDDVTLELRAPTVVSSATRQRTVHDGLARGMDRHEAIARQEFVDSVRRMRMVVFAGLFIWPAYAVFDLLVVWAIEPGPLTWYLVWRVVGIAVLGAVYLRLRREPVPSQPQFRAMDLLAFVSIPLLISANSVLAGGIDSSYAMGILVILLVRSALLAEPWRRGALPFAAIWACYPATMAVAALFDSGVLAQFGDARSLSIFLLHNSFLAGGAVLGTLTGDVVYRVRHAVYTSGRLGRYELKRRLGVGGMGEVWVAHHHTLRQDVALKVLRSERSGDAIAIARFEREVLTTTRLTHPNTIRVLDHGVSPDGLWYYAMELLRGYDLGQLIEREGSLEPARVVHLLTQVCGSLSEAHALGFVHRDIKPENLFVADMGGVQDFVKVLDFGIAKVSQDLEDTRLTREGMVTGTPTYLAPEVIRGEPADPRSDVYSLGCVLYAALTGRPPFRAKTAMEMLLKHAEHAPVPPSERLDHNLPAALEEAVLRCLAKQPTDRYADAQALGFVLEACGRELAAPAT